MEMQGNNSPSLMENIYCVKNTTKLKPFQNNSVISHVPLDKNGNH